MSSMTAETIHPAILKVLRRYTVCSIGEGVGKHPVDKAKRIDY